MFDIIGDIHGYAQTLESLLIRLGYSKSNGVYKHQNRQAIFLGDFIDRGPSIRECLQIVKPMVESGAALAVMGNHEYNAICYHTPTKNGDGWLRERSTKNVKQHQATLNAFADYDQDWKDYLEWFKTLPLFLDLGNLRVIHAFWDNQTIEKISDILKGSRLTEEFLHQSAIKNSEAYHMVENLLKGYELNLPDDIKYTDKDGFIRGEIRVRWWKQLNSETFRSICVKDGHSLPETPVPHHLISEIPIYSLSEPPVFIGHYWNSGTPALLAPNVCCVDYSVARGEKLVAYRWDDGSVLKSENMVWQNALD